MFQELKVSSNKIDTCIHVCALFSKGGIHDMATQSGFKLFPFTTIEDIIGHLSLCCLTPKQSQSELVIGEAVTRGKAPDPINIHAT